MARVGAVIAESEGIFCARPAAIWRCVEAGSRGLRDGYTRQLAFARATFTAAADEGLLRDGIDPVREADALYFLILGLMGPVLIGQLDAHEAIDMLDHQLSRIFRPQPLEG
jgi:hypothetical protein